MKYFFLIFISLNILTLGLYSFNVDRFFTLENEIDAVYYNASSISSDDYMLAETLKNKIIDNQNEIYSVIIADIFALEGNEYIILSGNTRNKNITVYSSVGDIIINYEIKNSSSDMGSKVEFESFMDRNKKINIIKYYSMEESNNERSISLHLFRINEASIDFIAEIEYYREVKSGKTDVILETRNVFVDMDNDRTYEMILEVRQRIEGSRDRVSYLVYEYDSRVERYICTESSWVNSNNYSHYFD